MGINFNILTSNAYMILLWQNTVMILDLRLYIFVNKEYGDNIFLWIKNEWNFAGGL